MKRNARVSLSHKKPFLGNRYQDHSGHEVQSIRVIKNTLDTDIHALTLDCSLEELSQHIVDSDPEVDIERFGKRVHDTQRVYLTSHNEPAVAVSIREVMFNALGEEQCEREFSSVDPNINTDLPLSWTGKLLPIKECIRKFSFVNAFQIQHIDGLTYDFLFNITAVP